MAIFWSIRMKPATVGPAKIPPLVMAPTMLSLVATSTQNSSLVITADVKSAVKVAESTTTSELDAKGLPEPHKSLHTVSAISELQRSSTQENQPSPGTSQFAEIHRAVEGAIEQLADQESISVPIKSIPTGSTTTTDDDEAVDSEEKTHKCEKKGKARAADTGLDRILEINCLSTIPTIQALHGLPAGPKANDSSTQMRPIPKAGRGLQRS
ncbi:hypothetical protein BP5796_03051 [Coleophoma crateriformis]|uniref:Uncharacterized protein n=1 Tax=Coleophoma crateriformis TaxID=565419 RepID=A0A3D8SM12_9HELO|nr:hypothetical protein BP5796_03051 [Coleophoma crateriformis]